MSEGEGAGRQQRYCRNCGVEAVPGNAFCVSCGERLAPGPEGPWRTGRSSASGRSPSIVAALREAFRGVAEKFGRFPTPSAGAAQGILRNLLRRVGELPVALKVAGAAVGAVLLLTLLSPLTAVGAAVLFVVSVVALSVRVVQQKSVVRWGMVAAASFVLALTTAGVSNAIYGGPAQGGSVANVGDGTQYAEQYAAVDEEDTALLQDAVFTPGVFAGEECASVLDCELIESIQVYDGYAEVLLFDVTQPTGYEEIENRIICGGVAGVAAEEGLNIEEVAVRSFVDRRAAPDYEVEESCEVERGGTTG